MKKKTIIVIAIVALFAIIVAGIGAKQYYHYEVSNFTSINGEEHTYFITHEMTRDSILALLTQDYAIESDLAWELTCQHMQFKKAKIGYYKLPAQISNRVVVRRFLLGEQTPYKLSFTQNIRTREELASHLGNKLHIDSAEIKLRLDSEDFMAKYGLNPQTAVCMFIPNTYEVYWTVTVDKLFDRMYKEYKHFWNEERLNKADKIGFSPTEVATLASIIASETNKSFEYPIVASIYINRVRKNIPLQACPTVIFAVGDFSIRRVLNKHLEFDSPYNTYKYRGLPPGPILLTRPELLDAVLNAPETDYLFMCANPDFSGTHIFSSSYVKHQAVARRYQQELNKRKIQH